MFISISIFSPYASASGKSRQFPEKRIFPYQGEFNLKAGLEVGGGHVLGANVLSGVRFNPYLFTGFGVGFEYFDLDFLSVPVYFNAKGYLPIGHKTNMFFGTDIGLKYFSETASTRFYFGPEYGFNFEVGKRMGINLSLK